MIPVQAGEGVVWCLGTDSLSLCLCLRSVPDARRGPASCTPDCRPQGKGASSPRLRAWRQRRGRDGVTPAGASGCLCSFRSHSPRRAPPRPLQALPTAQGHRPQGPAETHGIPLLHDRVTPCWPQPWPQPWPPWYLPKTQYTEGFRGPSLFQGPAPCGHRTQRHQQAGQGLCSLGPEARSSLLGFGDSVRKRTKEKGW